jgi:hypothetical protein
MAEYVNKLEKSLRCGGLNWEGALIFFLFDIYETNSNISIVFFLKA